MKEAMFAAIRVAWTSRRDQRVICMASRRTSFEAAYAVSSVILKILHAVAKRPSAMTSMARIPSRVGTSPACANDNGVNARTRSVAVPTPACTYSLDRTVLLAVQTASRCMASFQLYSSGMHCTTMNTRLMMQKRICAAMRRDSVIRHGRPCLKWRTVNAMPILINAVVGIQKRSEAKRRWWA